MHILSKPIFLAFCVILSGCTQRFQDTNATVKEAFFGFESVNMSPKHVANLPYASAYARINGEHRIFLVLAYAEQNPATGETQLKWMSSDKAMIVTEKGRIIKTLSLPSANLVSISATQTLPTPAANNTPWQAQYDWQPSYSFGHQANVQSHFIKNEWLTSLLWSKQTQLLEETVTFEALNTTMSNQFWVDEQNTILKSAQWVVPNKLHIELEILKPLALTQPQGNEK